jgi:hypothetical protein
MTTGSVVIYDPRFLTWEHWSALQVSTHLQHGPSVLQGVPESDWKKWAAQFVSLPDHAGDGLPWPEFFKNWRDWAFAVNHIFAMAGD